MSFVPGSLTGATREYHTDADLVECKTGNHAAHNLPFLGKKCWHRLANFDSTNNMSDREVLALHGIVVSQDSLSQHELAEIAHIYRTYTMAVMLGCSKDGKINCMALVGGGRDTMPHLATIIGYVQVGGTPRTLPGEFRSSLSQCTPPDRFPP